MKLAATVILFNPTPDVFDNISSYLNQIGKLYIFDNSKEKIKFIPREIEEKSEYFHTGNNDVIAKRLNEALRYSMKDGFDFLLTMDQDSSFKECDLKEYINKISELQKSYKTLMYGIRYFNLRKNESSEIKIDTILITSGSIINLNAAKEVGKFDESLFIDEVDREYCLKGLRKGYTNIMIKDIKLIHNEGTLKRVLLPNFSFGYRMIHNPKRMYFKVKNFMYVRNKYPEYKNLMPYSDHLNVIKNNLIYGDEKLKSIYYIVKGLLTKDKF